MDTPFALGCPHRTPDIDGCQATSFLVEGDAIDVRQVEECKKQVVYAAGGQVEDSWRLGAHKKGKRDVLVGHMEDELRKVS